MNNFKTIMKFVAILAIPALLTAVPARATEQTIYLGSGCFWGAEKRYEATDGVLDAVNGYNRGAEVVKVVYDDSVVSTEQLIMNYFESHDPTQLNRQGNDRGRQYRSIIITVNTDHIAIANTLKYQYQALLVAEGYPAIKTAIYGHGKFKKADEFHQDYIKKNPRGYCPDHSTGIKFVNKKVDVDVTKGKQIVVLVAPDFCPYCEKFKKNTGNGYRGTIPLSYLTKDQLKGLELKTATFASPTIFFIEDGIEVFGWQGYMESNIFYKALGAFKLGDSEAYKVAFNENTDAPYCKQYDLFKDTPDGLFIDKLSGVPLFDTRNRFKSGTGWLSFTKAIDGSTTRHVDNSYGMERIELRSKSSGIHLGHLFPKDGPNGKDRYCINATILEFKERI